MDLVGTPTPGFAAKVPGAADGRTIAILPCGIDVDRFHPIDRREAREQLGLDPDGRYLLFPYDPARAVKHVDRARELRPRATAPSCSRSATSPTTRSPLWMNAANAVICPSDWETFGLACVEALACDVPVLARPTGSARRGAARDRGHAVRRMGPRDVARGARAAPRRPPIRGSPGRARALQYSADALAGPRRDGLALAGVGRSGTASILRPPRHRPSRRSVPHRS